MARKSLVGVVADELLDRIIAGDFPPGSSVPGELELSARHEVSRMTVREAMKTLEAQRILSVERGRGTFVNPLNRWASLEAVLRAASEGQNEAVASVQLIELRRMLETGACELAASRIGDDEITTLFGYLAAMRAAHEVNDVPAFVEADLFFRGPGQQSAVVARDEIPRTFVNNPLHDSLAAVKEHHLPADG